MSNELREALGRAAIAAKAENNQMAQGVLISVSCILNLPYSVQHEAFDALMAIAGKHLTMMGMLSRSEN